MSRHYVALCIARLMQFASKNKHSIHTMLDELSQLSCTNVGSNLWAFDQTSDVIDDMFGLIGKEAPEKWMTTAQIKALFNKSTRPAMFV